jgi:hypothetical protein
VVLPLSLFHMENHVCLSHGVGVIGAAWRAAIRIMTRVGDQVKRTRVSRTGRVHGGWVIERSSDIVCCLYRAQGD